MTDPVKHLVSVIEDIFDDIFPDQQSRVRKALDAVKFREREMDSPKRFCECEVYEVCTICCSQGEYDRISALRESMLNINNKE